MVQAASSEKVERLTYLSGMFVSPQHRDQPSDNAKYQVEQALKESGVAYTIFKPTYFMDTLPRHIQGNRALLIGSQPHPLHIVASNDFAQMVVKSYSMPETACRSFYVYGPEAIRLEEALRMYCQRLASDKTVGTAPFFLMKLVSRFFLGGRLDRTIGVLGLLQKYGEVGDPSEAWRIFGRPATSLAKWCDMQVARQGAR